MLSYQHGYHAGNPADLHKHIVLIELLTQLRQKDRGLTYIDTHAGRGRYDLDAPEAHKTGEAARGIGAVALGMETALGATIAAIRAVHGPTAYPGSPAIAAHGARSQDRIILIERHPAEFAALKTAMRGTTAELHERDGYEGVIGLSPPKPRKGLVLIDPAYEVKSEYDQAATLIPRLLTKWPEASILLWYPILKDPRHQAISHLSNTIDRPAIRHEVTFTAAAGHRMIGSGLLLLNAPYGSDAAFAAALSQSQGVLRPA